MTFIYSPKWHLSPTNIKVSMTTDIQMRQKSIISQKENIQQRQYEVPHIAVCVPRRTSAYVVISAPRQFHDILLFYIVFYVGCTRYPQIENGNSSHPLVEILYTKKYGIDGNFFWLDASSRACSFYHIIIWYDLYTICIHKLQACRRRMYSMNGKTEMFESLILMCIVCPKLKPLRWHSYDVLSSKERWAEVSGSKAARAEYNSNRAAHSNLLYFRLILMIAILFFVAILIWL